MEHGKGHVSQTKGSKKELLPFVNVSTILNIQVYVY